MRHEAWQPATFTARILACLSLVWLCCEAALAQVEGTPEVIDGQTLTVAGQRLHLYGVAAPALDQVCERRSQSYPCGKVARAQLWDLIGGLDVTCKPVDGPAAEAAAATCTAGAAKLNEDMVRSGWALAEHAAGAPYDALQAEAKKAGRGLWRSEFEPPAAARAPE